MFLFTVVTLCSLFVDLCYGFNVATSTFDQFSGITGSQFGYSVTLHSNSEGKWLIVGAPRDNMTAAPELTRPGNVYRCKLQQNTNTCQAFTIRTTESTRPAGWPGYEEDNQFLGGSIVKATNKIVVCAQQWKNLNDRTFRLERPVGRCHEITNDLNTVISTKIFTYNNYYTDGYSYAMALIGTTAIAGDVADQVIVGGPGMWDSKGGFIKYDTSRNTGFFNTWSARSNTNIYNNFLQGAEMGMSLAIGNFGPANNCGQTPVVAGVPHYATAQGHLGSFLIFCATGGGSNLAIRKQFTGNKIGSGFGTSLAVADVNNDGLDDVLVGAPLQEVTSYDEGTVFVYYGTGDNQYLDSGFQNLYGTRQVGGRFGASIVSLGDINKDGFNDIAIGAPNEDNGAGAVYIFNGQSPRIRNVYSQRIAASTLFPGIKSFGTSISLPMDYDNNNYNDFAVGAFQSDSTYIFRTTPVVNMVATFATSPANIPLSSDGLECSAPGSDLPCVTVVVCFSYTGTNVPASTVANYSLNADLLMTGLGKASRVSFFKNEVNSGSQYTSPPITVSSTGQTCDRVFARVTTTSREFFSQITTPVNFAGDFRLTEQSSGNTIKPTQNAYLPTSLSGGASFETNCVGICNPDLRLSLTKEDKVITFGETVDYRFTITVRNLGEPAFSSRISTSITTNNAMFLGYDTLLDQLSVPVTCSADSGIVLCDFPNAFFQSQVAVVRLRYNVSSAALVNGTNNYNDMLTSISLESTVTSAGSDVSLLDNTGTITQNIRYSATAVISGSSSPEQKVATSAADQAIEFLHRYTLLNTGPSPLFAVNAYYSIPALLENLAEVVQARDYEIISLDVRSNCSIKYVPATHVGRQISLENSDGSQIENTEKNQQKAECSSMTDPRCVIIECRVSTIEPNQQTEVNIKFKVRESALDIKKIPEFRFYSKALVVPATSVLPDSLQANTTGQVFSFIYPSAIVVPETEINLWLIIGSVIGGLVLFVILGVILWKCGFFKREKKDKIEKWKRQSNFYEQRKTQALSKLRGSGPKDDEIRLSL